MIPSAALTALVDEIIPRDEAPGAVDAGVVGTLLDLLETQPPVAELIRDGLEALDRVSHARFGKPFADAPTPDRQALLQLLAEGTAPPGWQPTDPAPARFWTTIRSLVVGLFYNSPEGRRDVGFPGPSVDRGGYRHTIVRHNPLETG